MKKLLIFILAIPFMNCFTMIIRDLAEYRKYEKILGVDKIKKFITSENKVFLVFDTDVEIENSRVRRNAVEKCLLIKNDSEIKTIVRVNDAIDCPKNFQELKEIHEIKGKDSEKAILYVKDKIGIIEKSFEINGDWIGSPFYSDVYCECKDFPNFPIDSVIGFRTHIIVKFKNGTGYSLFTDSSEEKTFSKYNIPLGILSKQELNQNLFERCFEHTGYKFCREGMQNIDFYGEQELAFFAEDYGRLSINSFGGQKFSYSRKNTIFKQKITHLEIKDQIITTERKEKPYYNFLLPITIPLDVVTSPLQFVVLILTIIGYGLSDGHL